MPCDTLPLSLLLFVCPLGPFAWSDQIEYEGVIELITVNTDAAFYNSATLGAPVSGVVSFGTEAEATPDTEEPAITILAPRTAAR